MYNKTFFKLFSVVCEMAEIARLRGDDGYFLVKLAENREGFQRQIYVNRCEC